MLLSGMFGCLGFYTDVMQNVIWTWNRCLILLFSRHFVALCGLKRASWVSNCYMWWCLLGFVIDYFFFDYEIAGKIQAIYFFFDTTTDL